MKYFLRPYQQIEFVALLGIGVGMIAGSAGAAAQSTQIIELMQGTNPLLGHGSSQGYLGVWVDDVDQEKAQTLKLKDVRGAVVTLIDHDAPAGKIGLRVNDVVLQLNGENVEGAEQLRRMLKEIPPGRKVSMEFSRDGNVQTVSVQLADRRVMEHEVWDKIGNDSDLFVQSPGMGVLSGGGDGALPGIFHMPIFGSTLNVGAMVEPLTGQMADYLGVQSGLMVKQVAHKSEAASAGLKAFDVILRVGPEAVTTLSDWDRALRANQGKSVQVTILRDKKQQTLTLQVDSKHKTGALEFEEVFPNANRPQVATLEVPDQQLFSAQSDAAEKLREQAQSMKDAFPNAMELQVSPQTAEKLREQAEQLKDSLNAQEFKVDPKAMDDLKEQMKDFRLDIKPQDLGNLKVDPKAMDELKEQMKDFRLDIKPQDLGNLKVDPKAMDELKEQMKDFRLGIKPQDLGNGPY